MATKRPQLPSAEELFGDPTGARAASLDRTWKAMGLPTTAEEVEASKQAQRDWEIAQFQVRRAPHDASAPRKRKPRATKIAYNAAQEKLVINFTDGPWVAFTPVPLDVWNNLKGSSSTGRFLWDNGFDSRGPGGMVYDMDDNFNPDDMPPNTRVLFNA